MTIKQQASTCQPRCRCLKLCSDAVVQIHRDLQSPSLERPGPKGRVAGVALICQRPKPNGPIYKYLRIFKLVVRGQLAA